MPASIGYGELELENSDEYEAVFPIFECYNASKITKNIDAHKASRFTCFGEYYLFKSPSRYVESDSGKLVVEAFRSFFILL